MLYYSTQNKNTKSSLSDAIINGLANDNGLFMPERIPVLPESFFKNLSSMSFQEIAFEVASAFWADDIPENDLRELVYDALNFDTPLIEIAENMHVLELWHGPTMAFKDVAARFMARLVSYFSRDTQEDIHVLVATSGDTGSAVASGFYNIPGIKVIILYPSGGVSKIQEQLLTTLGGNVTALEVNGVFDDCQRMVKQAFLDDTLRAKIKMTSANSINIGRLIPQSFYYFNAVAQLKDAGKKPIVMSVPSGNYGNVSAGLIAKRMGLPVDKFIVSSNLNNTVPVYLATKRYVPRPSVATISNAMDVGDPSNFKRIVDLYNHDHQAISNDIEGYFCNDQDTRNAMVEIYKRHNYVMDPHGAVAYMGLNDYTSRNGGKPVNGIILETAHPAKFVDTVNETLNTDIAIPERLAAHLNLKKEAIKMPNSFDAFKEFLAS